MSQTLKLIPISEITTFKNYRDVNPPSASDPDVIELAESLKKHGIMQAVLVRPSKETTGHYQLIFGHRRLLACEVAGITEIPANIKEVADEDILELQVTENLQRKDVHPMDEAIAFEQLMKFKKLQVEEVALRFAKKPEYITQRISLNALIPDIQKLFKKNQMLLGHAILIARLSAADQKEILKSQFYPSTGFGAIANLQDYISRAITRDLERANFSVKDSELVKAAGACTTCPKRSGFNRLLFPDIPAKDDRCFDKSCFELKSDRSFIQTLKETIETKPNIHLVQKAYGDKPSPEVLQLLKELKVKILVESKDYSEHNYGSFKKKSSGLYISGYYKGQTETIYLPGPIVKGKDGKLVEEDPKEQIKKINEREKRAKELDLEKVHKQMLAQLDPEEGVLAKPGFPFQPIDSALIIYMLIFEVADYRSRNKIAEHLKWMPQPPGYNEHGYAFDFIKKLGTCSQNDLAFIIRTIAIDKWGNSALVSRIGEKETIMRIISEYAGIDIKSIEEAQAVASAKRQARVDTRIAQLKKEIKESKKVTVESTPKKNAKAVK